MKIKSLWVSEYKNIKDMSLTFGSDLTTLLVGQNGLGKSNLIEILTLIFKDLDLVKTEREMQSLSQKGDYFDYKIVYQCDVRDIIVRIEFVDGQITVSLKNPTREDWEDISFQELKNMSDILLPTRIIGYYSGENKRLEEMIQEYIEIEKTKQIRAYSKTLEEKKLRKIFFAENLHSQLILLTLAVYKNHELYGSKIRNFLTNYLLIEQIESFSCLFNNPKNRSYSNLKKSRNTIIAYEEKLANNEDVANAHNFWNLKGKVDKLLNVFFDYGYDQNNYIIYERSSNDKLDARKDKDRGKRWIKEYLELPEIIIEEIQGTIYSSFPDPIDFFDAIEACHVLSILNELEINIKKTGVERVFNYKNLSEGEQQLVSVIGMMMLVEEEDVLFLLDEPDTHINPHWQREYVKLINSVIVNPANKHVFLATHSPLLVQAYEDNVDLLLFKKEEDSIVIDTTNHTIKNWRIDHVLMSEYFNLPSSRPESIDDFMNLRRGLLEKKSLSAEDKDKLKELENELGYLPTGETILEIDSMIQINRIAKLMEEE